MIPTFKTERLIIREMTEADLPNYEKYFIDYEVIRYLTASVPWPYPAEGVRDYLNQEIIPYLGKERWLWGIFLQKSPGELIGAIELRRKANPDNRGFWLGKKFWGRGIMTEALVPITNYAFDLLGFEKMVFTNAVGNGPSHRIKDKMGARLLYTKPAKFVDPDFKEHEVWELSKEAWQRKSINPQ